MTGTRTTKKKLSFPGITAYAGIGIALIVITSVVLLLFFPPRFVRTYVKERIIHAAVTAYPDYSITIADIRYTLTNDNLECDSVVLVSHDSTVFCTIARFSMSGISWIKEFIHEEKFESMKFTRSIGTAQSVTVDVKKIHYRFSCERLHFSVPDSEVSAENIEMKPLTSDKDFFAGSKFRKPRIALALGESHLKGFDCMGLVNKASYRVRSALFQHATFHCLLNKEKPFDENAPKPMMPNEFLSSLTEELRIDSVTIHNAHMTYAERFEKDGKAAAITAEHMQIEATGITNRPAEHREMKAHAEGNVMGSSVMKLDIVIPTSPEKSSFRYSGSLDKFSLPKISPFLEANEHYRVTSGILHKASFAITVINAHAQGTVREEYSDLDFEMLDKDGKSKTGFFHKNLIFLAKIFKIRSKNIPDKSGSLKIGRTDYRRKPNQTFLEFSWLALREGITDVIGFHWPETLK